MKYKYLLNNNKNFKIVKQSELLYENPAVESIMTLHSKMINCLEKY